MNLQELLKSSLPNDHSRQVTSWYFVDKVLAGKKIDRVMDLGCGAGHSVEYFKKKTDAIWTGLDIELPEAANAVCKIPGAYVLYDGIKFPFPDESFDMVFSNQVFEHILYPRKVIAEIARVLRPGGCFVGSVSHLEPYHSLSFWNYTPYGFKILLEESNLELKEIRPSVDALTLISRRLLNGTKIRKKGFLSRYLERESPLNQLIGLAGTILRKSHEDINLIKLLFCGQFAFMAIKNNVAQILP